MTKSTGKRPRKGSDLRTKLEFYSMPEPNSGCVLWLGTCAPPPREYGYLLHEGEKRGAHVWAWELANGRRVPAGMDVRHTCDVPPCINDLHLKLGTRRNNMQDMIERGRSPLGIARPNAKLNDDAVRAIRASSETLAVLAERLGIGVMTISLARRGLTWRHVTAPENRNSAHKDLKAQATLTRPRSE